MLKLLWLYYKDLIRFNIPFSIIVGLVGMFVSGFLNAFCFSFLTGGFLLSIYFYNLRYSSQYYFYYNKGLTKIHLWSGCCMINVVVVFILNLSFGYFQ